MSRLAQGTRILSRPRRPGSHPLRALRTGAARPTLPAREWAAVSCYADPVMALAMAAWVMDNAQWQWAPVPASFARVVLDSGALRHIRRVVDLGAAHAGRYAAPTAAVGDRHTAPCLLSIAHSTSRSTLSTLTRRCCRSVPAAELNTQLIAHGACPALWQCGSAL